MEKEAKFSDLTGAVLTDVVGLEPGSDMAHFLAEDGREWRMWHDQDCCESVSVDDVCGDVADLIGSTVLSADERSSEEEGFEEKKRSDYDDDSFTWTFYRISTIKGTVVIRWYGTSNGYYSERVSFSLIGGGA